MYADKWGIHGGDRRGENRRNNRVVSLMAHNAPGGGRSLEGERVPSTARQNQAVDRVIRLGVENVQRKSTPFIGGFCRLVPTWHSCPLQAPPPGALYAHVLSGWFEEDV